VITWTDPENFELDGQRYRISIDGEEMRGLRSTDECFVLGKSRRMVDRFWRDYHDRDDVQRIVELGIYQGGSSAFYAQVCRPTTLVGIERTEAPAIALERFIARRDLGHVIRPSYGVDQENVQALLNIVKSEFDRPELDLVIDDASHHYRPTRTSFEVLFPLLREDGHYVIEDWAWAHYPGVMWQERGGYLRDHPALTNLLVEIVMLAGSRPDVVSDVRIDNNLVEGVRGPSHLDAPMDLARLYRNRGHRFRPLL
jgi:SAM-dependent methyltransferase